MTPFHKHLELSTRRYFLQQSTAGLGAVALAGLIGQEGSARPIDDPLSPKTPPLEAKAKRVIYLHMTGSLPTWTYTTTSPSSKNFMVKIAHSPS